jgi:hypothetical protein
VLLTGQAGRTRTYGQLFLEIIMNYHRMVIPGVTHYLLYGRLKRPVCISP